MTDIDSQSPYPVSASVQNATKVWGVFGASDARLSHARHVRYPRRRRLPSLGGMRSTQCPCRGEEFPITNDEVLETNDGEKMMELPHEQHAFEFVDETFSWNGDELQKWFV
jgi:hypothetical protein